MNKLSKLRHFLSQKFGISRNSIEFYFSTASTSKMYSSNEEAEQQTHNQGEFKRLFKFYKRRDKALDLSRVVDLHEPATSAKINCSPIQNCYSFPEIKGLRQISDWKLLILADRPGLFVITGALTRAAQLGWIKRALLHYPEPPNITNLCFQSTNPFNGKQVFRTCGPNKLRWVTMGNDYNWDTKQYAERSRNRLPDDMAELARIVVKVLNLGQFSPDAAIVNYYPEKSYLSPHVDRSELDLQKPLVSFSFGQPAIYLTGGKTLDEPVEAILLRSGDILVMSGQQRLVYHGVPRVLSGQAAFDGIENGLDEHIDKDVLDYANRCRINITVRQVAKDFTADC